jgi:hypothetical protein
LFLTKWRTKNEEEVMATYLEEHILKHRFSRCHSVPGKPTAMRQVDMCSDLGYWRGF